jgi:hypothetical protein
VAEVQLDLGPGILNESAKFDPLNKGKPNYCTFVTIYAKLDFVALQCYPLVLSGHDLNLQGNIAYGAYVPLFILNGPSVNGGRRAARYRRDGNYHHHHRHCRHSFSVGEGSFLAI